jgi:hypothetical protein
MESAVVFAPAVAIEALGMDFYYLVGMDVESVGMHVQLVALGYYPPFRPGTLLG